MNSQYQVEVEAYLADVQQKADKHINRFIIGFFILGLLLAPLYETWVFSFTVGGLNLMLYALARRISNKFLSRQIISSVFSVFVLQFIGQMHGIAESHFFFFTNIAILILYQDWRMMVPYTAFAILHHSVFFYFQMLGYDHLGEYFINYTEVSPQVLIFHYGLAILMAVIAGLWATMFRNQSIALIGAQERLKMKKSKLEESEQHLKDNIEEITKIQESLTGAQERIDFILRGTGVGLWEFDLASQTFFWDPKSKDLLGFGPEDDIDHERWRSLIPAENLEMIDQAMLGYINNDVQQYDIEYPITMPNGQRRFLLAKSSIRHDADGRSSIVGTLQDISERKQQEEEIMRLSLVASKTFNGVVITNAQRQVEWVNKGFERITGYQLEDVKGKSLSMLQGTNTDPEHVQLIKQGLDSKKSFSQEILNYSKEGKPYWLELSITPVFGKNGEVMQFVGIERDITQRKKLEEMVQIQTTELQNSLGQVIELQQKSERERHQTQRLLENMQASINYAQRIQQAILPSEKDIELLFPNSFLLYRPKDIVSGDFYWVAEKGNTRIIAVGDCTGHGVPGAFMTMIANNLLNQVVHNMEVHSPNAILSAMPQLLQNTLVNTNESINDGMDISVVAITHSDDGLKLSFAGAMSTLYFVQDGALHEIKGDKVAIGGRHQSICHLYELHEIAIQHPTTIYLASDGYKDQFGGGQADRKFLSRNFKDMLLSISHEPAQTQKRLMEDIFDAWKGNKKQTDDVLVVGIGLDPAEGAMADARQQHAYKSA